MEWESLGIANDIAIPRLHAALTGTTPDGAAVEGEYKFINEGPMADGLNENIEFFELSYEDPDLIDLGRRFSAIAPLLWIRAGGKGRRISDVSSDWSLPDDAVYGVLFDTNTWREFADAVEKRTGLASLFIVTDSESTFQQIAGELPTNIPCTQLYEDYINTFEINTIGDL